MSPTLAPKAPVRKYKICEGETCGNCQGCKRTEGYQPCKYVPNPSEPQEERLEESTVRYGMKRNFQLGVLAGAGAVVAGYYLGQFLFSIGI